MTIEAALWQDDRQQKQAIQQAWLTAALGRQKRMPSLQKLLTGPAKKLHGDELRKRRAEHAQMASDENVAAINAHMRKMKAVGNKG